MQKTKFSILILALLFTFTVNSFAQTDSSKIDLAGKYALQFQITRYLTLSNFQGATFSGKYHFSNSSAIRIGVRLITDSEDNTRSTTSVIPDTTISQKLSYSESEQYITFIAQYLYYNSVNDDITMFLGAGINFTTTPRSSDGNLHNDYIETYEYEYTSYGAQVLIGVEWFVRSNIGLSAEYSSKFEIYDLTRTKTFEDSNSGSKMTDVGEYSGKRFLYDQVKFGLSVYF